MEKYGLKVFNYAISNKNEIINFYPTFDDENNNYAPCGSLNKKFISFKRANENPLIIKPSVKINSITIKEFCKLNDIKKINLLHVDVEGHTIEVLEVLEGLGDIMPKMIYIEVKSDTHDHTDKIGRLLKILNYKRILRSDSDEVWIN